jgi:predicted HTH transcriptional regulator
MDPEELKLLIAEGEGPTLEFKERFSSRVLEDIVAFANGRGGQIFLGVADNGKIRGEKLTNSLKSQIVSMASSCDLPIPVSIEQVGSAVIIGVGEGVNKPYSCSSGYYRRVDAATQKMTQEEIKAIFLKAVGRLMGKVEHIGSGMRKVKKLLEEPGLKQSSPKESSYPKVARCRSSKLRVKKAPKKVPVNITRNQRTILDACSKNGNVTIFELASKVGISDRKIKVNISKLKVKGLIRRVGPDRGGHWEVLL